jgi:hypothetical protein
MVVGSGVHPFALTQINVLMPCPRFHSLNVRGARIGRLTMVADRIGLIGLSAIILMATAALAQNTSSPALSGNTVNPVLSGNSTVLSGRTELSVPPALPNTLIQPNPGRNSLNGLPCTGVGLLSVSPTLPGATVAPGGTGTAISNPNSGSSTIQQLPSFPSVYSPTAAC